MLSSQISACILKHHETTQHSTAAVQHTSNPALSQDEPKQKYFKTFKKKRDRSESGLNRHNRFQNCDETGSLAGFDTREGIILISNPGAGVGTPASSYLASGLLAKWEAEHSARVPAVPCHVTDACDVASLCKRRRFLDCHPSLLTISKCLCNVLSYW